MKILRLKDLEKPDVRKEVSDSVKRGDIIVYPTDTIYGIGCNAENSESVARIYQAKKRDRGKPFSVIIPSKEWIYEHCFISDNNREFLNQLLPGPYTAVLKYKSVPEYLKNSSGTIGVRMVKNQFCDILMELGIIFITTSLNISEEEVVRKIKDIPETMKGFISMVIDAGELGSHGSRVFDLTTDSISVLRP